MKLVNIWLNSALDDLEQLKPLRKNSKDTQAAHLTRSINPSIAHMTDKKLNHSGWGSPAVAMAVLNGIIC